LTIDNPRGNQFLVRDALLEDPPERIPVPIRVNKIKEKRISLDGHKRLERLIPDLT
jgi:hypothetical protein